MPRYYFDLHNDVETIDEEGQEFPDFDAARTGALLEVRHMIEASVSDTAKVDLRHRIDVRDAFGETIHTLHFEDAVRFVRNGQPV